MLWVCVCMLALVIRHANPIFSAKSCIVSCGLSGCTVFFPITSQTARFSKKKKKSVANKICVPILSTSFVWNFLFLRRIQRDFVINVRTSSCEVPLFMSDFNETWNFQTDFRNTVKHQISWKSAQWEPTFSMRTDRHDEVSSRFSQFCERA